MYKGKKVIAVTGGLNEEGKIGRVIEAMPDFVDECVAIDDGSTDGTREEAEKAGATVLVNETNMGPGHVLKKGIGYAIDKRYDYIVIVAGDGQDEPAEIEKLIEPLAEGYDLVQGSRYIENKSRIPLFRKITTRMFTKLFNRAAKAELTDASNGFRAFRRELIEKVGLPEGDRYEFEPRLLMAAHRNGRVKEVPVVKRYGQNGYSKMKAFGDWYGICKPLLKEMLK